MAADTISLRAAAEQLGLHYMTVYRYVRTGRLAAHKQGGQWHVTVADLEALLDGGPPERPRGVRTDAPQRLEDRMLAADEPGAWAVVSQALTSGAEPEEIHLRLLLPAMRSIGERWASGEIEILDEHQATVIATRIVARMGPRFRRRGGPGRGHIVVGLPSGDTHALASAVIADLLRGRGFVVTDLGADTPAESFLEVMDGDDPLVGVVISSTTSANFDRAVETIDAIRSVRPNATIAIGGPGVPDQETADRAGADIWTADIDGLLDTFDQLVRPL